MKLMYSRPILRDLSQGSRIAFARQFRGKTQDEISGLLGATGANRRRTMTRYEKGDRNPNVTRTKLIADLLGVSYHAIKQYDCNDSLDFIYILLWLEELLPNYQVSGLAKSVYYYTLSKIDKDDKNKEIFINNKEIYGYRRITLELRNQGYNVNHKKVYRLMVKLGLKPLMQINLIKNGIQMLQNLIFVERNVIYHQY